MKKITILLIAILVLSGCTYNEKDDKINVVTTLFPIYDFVRQIAKDRVNVTLLLPPGIDAHTYEPTPKDIAKISNSNLFINTNESMEPWVKTITNSLPNLNVLDVSLSIDLHEDHDHEKDHHHDIDPHIWTDPNNVKIMVENILYSLCEIDDSNCSYYIKNADNYKAKLDDLIIQLDDISKDYDGEKIVFSGKFAFHYMFERYGLEKYSVYEGCSTEGDISPKVIVELIEYIKTNDIKIVFYEELSNSNIRNTILDNTNAKLLLLHSMQNISKEEMSNDVTYLSLMKQNIQNLREALKHGDN